MLDPPKFQMAACHGSFAQLGSSQPSLGTDPWHLTGLGSHGVGNAQNQQDEFRTFSETGKSDRLFWKQSKTVRETKFKL